MNLTDNISAALQYARDHQQDFLSCLENFIRIPSVSNNVDHRTAMRQAAEWLEKQLLEIGCMDVSRIPTAGAPVVYGELRSASSGQPTILVYGHYDVQPAENESAWDSPPYEPQIRGDEFFGRGTSDMKGQIIAILSAVKALLAHEALRANLKFIFEGEEEIGSPNLKPFLLDHCELLQSDFALNLDIGFLGPDMPTISYSLRGIASFELFVSGPKSDLHSGVFGGVVHNPALVLATALAGLIDKAGKIQLPNFYDSVIPMGADERQKLSQLPMGVAYYQDQTGVQQLWGESGFTPTERVAGRPTCDINGMKSGYLGEGGKTIIPSTASAKITTRLVPEQSPEEVHEQFLAYLQACMPSTVVWRLEYYGGGSPYLIDYSSLEVKAFAEALEKAYGKKALFFRDGGSVAGSTLMKDSLGLDSILSGFGLPSDHIHAPNEHIHLPTWYCGINTLIYYFSLDHNRLDGKEDAI